PTCRASKCSNSSRSCANPSIVRRNALPNREAFHMHAVVNHPPLKDGTDWVGLARKFDDFNATIAHPDFRGLSIIRATDTEAILLVLFETRAALADVTRNIAMPWFAENVRPYLAGPVSRHVGEIAGGALSPKS